MLHLPGITGTPENLFGQSLAESLAFTKTSRNYYNADIDSEPHSRVGCS